MQIEVILGLMSYICLGIAYTLHDYGAPMDLVEDIREEVPEFDDVDMVAPLFARGLAAFIWCLFMLIWPWYLVCDITKWFVRNTIGRLVKRWKKSEELEKEGEEEES